MRFHLIAVVLLVSKMAVSQNIDEGKRFLYYERYQSAKDALQKVLANKPYDGETTFWLGRAEMGLKDSAGAMDLYSKIASHTNDPWALICAGELELERGKPADARNDFETAISLTRGRDAGVLAAIARVNVDAPQGDAGYAIDKLNQAIEKEKKHVGADLYVGLGDAYAKQTDGGNAVINYNNALQADSKYAAAHYKIGLIYETQRNPAQYISEYEAAIAADPNFGPGYFRLYVHYYSRDVEKSRDYLTRYTAHADPGPLVDEANVDILFASQHYREAVERGRALLGNAPDAFKPHYYKLMAYANDSLHNYGDAKADMDGYFNRPDGQLTARNYLEAAHIYYKGGYSTDSVFAFLNRAVAMDTSSLAKEAYIHYAADLSDSLHDPVRKAYWVGQIYLADQQPDPTDLYNWGSQLFIMADAIRAADASAKTGASDLYYRKADSVFAFYIDKFPNYAVYGLYWRARANWSLDTNMDKGLAVPYFEKMINVVDTSRDSARFADEVKLGAWFLATYYYRKKDYKNALAFDTRYLMYDPSNDQYRRMKVAMEKYLTGTSN